MIQKGSPVEVEIDLATKFYDDELNSFNVVAEIPGTDLKDEVVMLGAHFDSWHSGTGATDNGAGSVVVAAAVGLIAAATFGWQQARRVAVAVQLRIAGDAPDVGRHLPVRRVGVPEDIAAHLFDPFVTTKSSGSGLGLALVAKIVHDHGGIVECESNSRKTTFRVLMPMFTALDGRGSEA